eukprot:1695518-Amphidinium_carterae.1
MGAHEVHKEKPAENTNVARHQMLLACPCACFVTLAQPRQSILLHFHQNDCGNSPAATAKIEAEKKK